MNRNLKSLVKHCSHGVGAKTTIDNPADTPKDGDKVMSATAKDEGDKANDSASNQAAGTGIDAPGT